ENAAARAHNRFATKFVQRDWESVATVFTEDSVYDDRRRVLGGIYRGRGDVVAMAKGVADIGVSDFVTNVLATRGDRLCLRRTRLVGRDRRPEAFHTDLLQVFEVDASGRIALWVTFDLDQLDAAYAELEARYVADEAAPHTGAWQLVVDNNAALSRRKFAPVTSDFEFVDHRRGGASIGTGQVTAYMRATFEDTPDAQYRTTAVHALADHGAVVCVSVEGTSQHGFEAVWSLLNVIIVRDGRIARIEFFADDDLDAARARFEQLAPSHVALENAATRVVRRLQSAVNRASWDDMESLLASDFTQEDRRRDRLGLPVVSRRAYLAGAQASEAIGLTHVEGMVLATRGDRLALVQQVLRGADDRPDASRWEWLCIGGVDGAGLCAISIWFDPDDFDAALAELEALYIAGEASAHAEVWRLVTDVYASYNRHEFPAVAPGFASVDHRRASFAPGELAADLQGLFELVPDIRFRITAVHALDEHGAVITSTAEGRSADGFDARWANVHVITVRDGQVAGMEMYPDDQIDAAVARFAQLAQSQPALANAATRTIERMHAAFNGDRWDDDADWLAADFTQEDRRRDRLGLPVVSRRAFVAGARAWRELPALIPHVDGTALAIRGDRLTLGLDSVGGNDDQPGAPRWEYLFVFGVDDHGRCNSQVWFDPDDLDAAYAELDARYLAGEAAPFAETWATMVEIFAAYNARDSARFRGLLSDDIVDVDHRPASLGFTKGMWSLVPDIAFRVVSVPALASHGAVMQVAGTGTSTSGMAAEWSLVQLALVESGLVTRVEIFPDDQLDAALARLAELDADAPV
ncbi:MAG TPA: nuclear transport factor 2 family protein, partial [Acidimicrobiales bacterium]|nr:nuclear transport factor 2 family protein [Acidimicrobiales bacterium]